jgi:hypothetical protein
VHLLLSPSPMGTKPPSAALKRKEAAIGFTQQPFCRLVRRASGHRRVRESQTWQAQPVANPIRYTKGPDHHRHLKKRCQAIPAPCALHNPRLYGSLQRTITVPPHGNVTGSTFTEKLPGSFRRPVCPSIQGAPSRQRFQPPALRRRLRPFLAIWLVCRSSRCSKRGGVHSHRTISGRQPAGPGPY